MDTVSMTARAKINLSLKVLNRRGDGYHNIESIMQQVAFGDEVTVSRREDSVVAIVTNHPELPVDEGNIACRAALLLQERFHIPHGFTIHLNKRIPVAAGLAGGSTNAAAVLRLVNRLCDLGLSADALAELGAGLGADVPFCVRGGAALAEGIGERLTPVTGLSGCYIVLANPGVGVSTAAIYKALDGENPPAGGDTKALAAHLAAGNLPAAFCEMKNVMEPVAEKHCPAISGLLEKLKRAGAVHSMMSGSGATCFGIFMEKPEEAALRAILGEDLVAVTTPVNQAEQL